MRVHGPILMVSPDDGADDGEIGYWVQGLGSGSGSTGSSSHGAAHNSSYTRVEWRQPGGRRLNKRSSRSGGLATTRS